MSQLKIRGLSKSFGSVAVLKDIDLDVDDREFVVLVGPSGCGKSTLLRLMCGLEEITEGDLFIDGERMNDVPAAQRGLAMVFQSYALYPHMTVAQNMSVGLRIAKVKKDIVRQKVAAAADILQLTDFLDRLPKQLSGGQRQRVAIGRAIVRNPKIFLFDEPLSNLDAALRLQMRLELARLHQELKSTIVYVTHDQVEAMTLADKIIVMNMGRIEQIGSPLELYRQPRNRFVAGFIGSPKMNFFEGEVTDVTESGAHVRLAGDDAVLMAGSRGMTSGASVTLGIRPEQITECGDGEDCENRLGVKVSVVERLGSNTYAYAQTERGVPVTIELDGMSRVRPGDLLKISLRAADLQIFTEDGDALA